MEIRKTHNGLHMMKRIVGLPHETVEVRFDGTVAINGTILEEPYAKLDPAKYDRRRFYEQTILLREEECFVMGDNRDDSLDSRQFGPIQTSAVQGKVVYVFFRGFYSK